MNTSLEALNSTQVIWNKVLSVMKNRMEEISFLTWIKSIDSVFINTNKMVLCVPSIFELGAVVKLENPDIKVKTEVLKRYCKSKGITLPYEIIELITNGEYAGMREFKGTINRIKAMAELSGQEINTNLDQHGWSWSCN